MRVDVANLLGGCGTDAVAMDASSAKHAAAVSVDIVLAPKLMLLRHARAPYRQQCTFDATRVWGS